MAQLEESKNTTQKRKKKKKKLDIQLDGSSTITKTNKNDQIKTFIL